MDVLMLYCKFLLYFFFQAEDGIRDLYVTGVQTCALPIWDRRAGGGDRDRGFRGGREVRESAPRVREADLGLSGDSLLSRGHGHRRRRREARSEERRVGKECRARWSTYR